MNGLILVKTVHPIENVLSKFIPIVQIGFIIDDQIYMIDNYDLYNFPIHRGIVLEIFKKDILLESMTIKTLKNISPQAFKNVALEIMNSYKKPTLQQLIRYLFKLEKIHNNMDMVDLLCGKLQITIDTGFNDWVPVILPGKEKKYLKLKYIEIMTVLEPKLKQAAGIFIHLSIEYGMPKFTLDNSYKELCGRIFDELDSSIETSSLNLDTIEQLKKEYLNLG